MNRYPEIKINDFSTNGQGHYEVSINGVREFSSSTVGSAIDFAHILVEEQFSKQIAKASKKEDSSENVNWKRHLNGRKR